jgi:phage-related protein
MPTIGPRCHELRVRDPEQRQTWRIIYRVDHDAVIVGDVFSKKSRTTPKVVVDACRRRYRSYDAVT